jgi:hypothetical protein
MLGLANGEPPGLALNPRTAWTDGPENQPSRTRKQE